MTAPSPQQQSDHDLLIAVHTLQSGMFADLKTFINMYETRHQALVDRVSSLEQKDSRDSEKFRSIADEIQRVLDNAKRLNDLENDVTALQTDNNTNKDEIRNLRNSSRFLDGLNAVLVVIGSILAAIFGR